MTGTPATVDNPSPQTDVSHGDMANAIRFLAADAVQKANSGHPGMPMGMADVATVLFSRFLKFDPMQPDWPDRDRFVLSAGHGSMLLYSVLHLTGYEDISMDEIRNFRLSSQLAYCAGCSCCSVAGRWSSPLARRFANVTFVVACRRANS